MSETQLTVLNNTSTEISIPVAQLGGLGLDLTSDLLKQSRPATLNIVQPNSTAEGAIKGNLRVAEADIQYKTMRVAFLDTPLEKRSYYVGEAGQLNRSAENLHCFCPKVEKDKFKREISKPSDKSKYPQAQRCYGCPKASWDEYRAAKDKGNLAGLKDLIPPCESYYYAVLIDTEFQMPLQMFVRSKSKQPFETGLGNFVRQLMMIQAKTKKVPNIFDVSFTLSTKLITTGKFPSYILNMSDFKATTDEEREAFGAVFAQYVEQKQSFQTAPDEFPMDTPEGQSDKAQEDINAAVLDGEYVADATTGEVAL